MGKDGTRKEGCRAETGEATGGGAWVRLGALREPIRQWIPAVDLPALQELFRLALEVGTAPTVGGAELVSSLAADIAWLADYLAWIEAYREKADLTRQADEAAGRVAGTLAALLTPLVADLSAVVGGVPSTWNEEEALRRCSTLLLPEEFRESLEWASSLAYVVGLYYETPQVEPERHLPELLEAGKAEAETLSACAVAFSAAPLLTQDQKDRLLLAAVELQKVAKGELPKRSDPTTPWKRRPAAPSRRT